jgi:hypothetical protein
MPYFEWLKAITASVPSDRIIEYRHQESHELTIKSLLTSLYQREDLIPSLAKRGKGRFYDKCLFNNETFNKRTNDRNSDTHRADKTKLRYF